MRWADMRPGYSFPPKSNAGEPSRKPGLPYLIHRELRRFFNRSADSFELLHHRLFKSRSFTFRGLTYHYFYHKYNVTWRNERAVEVPIIWEVVQRYAGRRILEVGNVLSHYFTVTHDILDKYEKADRVINHDVADFRPSRKYDLIVSISTLEHVGWDEEPREPMKFLRAIGNLTNSLAPQGELVVTLPLGHNLEMDNLLEHDKVPFTEQGCLKRISADNKWEEVDRKYTQYTRYNYLDACANEVVVGIIRKSC